jgi:hypothetical protein
VVRFYRVIQWLSNLWKFSLFQGKTMFDVYSATVILDGEFCAIKADKFNTDSLREIGALYGYEVCIKIVNVGVGKNQSTI